MLGQLASSSYCIMMLIKNKQTTRHFVGGGWGWGGREESSSHHLSCVVSCRTSPLPTETSDVQHTWIRMKLLHYLWAATYGGWDWKEVATLHPWNSCWRSAVKRMQQHLACTYTHHSQTQHWTISYSPLSSHTSTYQCPPPSPPEVKVFSWVKHVLAVAFLTLH